MQSQLKSLYVLKLYFYIFTFNKVLIHIKILVVFASYPESLYTKTQSF